MAVVRFLAPMNIDCQDCRKLGYIADASEISPNAF